MDFPEIQGANMQTLALLGVYLFTAIQFNKGKVWPDTWTGRISLLAPLPMAAIAVWGSPRVNAFAQAMVVIYMIGVGAWAINKASKTPPQA